MIVNPGQKPSLSNLSEAPSQPSNQNIQASDSSLITRPMAEGSTEASMRQPGNFKLRITSDTNKIDLPSVVLMLEQDLISQENYKNQSENAIFPANLRAQDFQSPEEYVKEHAQCLEKLLKLLPEKPGIQIKTLEEFQNKLGSHSPYCKYGNTFTAYNSKDHIIVEILNMNRKIANTLIESPVDLAELTLQHFPPAEKELLCLDGVLARLVTSYEIMEQDLVKSGIRPADSLLQSLNTETPKPSLLFRNILLELALKFNIQQLTSTGNAIHIPNALLEILGVNPYLAKQTDDYAHGISVEIMDPIIYNTLTHFPEEASKRISDFIGSVKTQDNLAEFNSLLLTAKESPSENYPDVFATLNEHSICKSLIPSNEQKTFEQFYGKWDDYSFNLEDWDYSKIESDLSEKLSMEWGLNNNCEPALSKLQINPDQNNKPLYEKIHTAITGVNGNNEQFFALQLLINSIGSTTSQKSGLVRNNVLFILKNIQLWSTTLEGATQNRNIKASRYFHDFLNTLIEKTPQSVNRQLLFNLQDRFCELLDTLLPYSHFPLHSILNAIENAPHKSIGNMQDFVITHFMGVCTISFNKLTLRDLAEFQHNLISTSDDLEILLRCYPDQQAQDLFRFFGSLNTRLKNQALIEVTHKVIAQLPTETTSSSIVDFFTRKGSIGSLHPEILAMDTLHEMHPELALHIIDHNLNTPHLDLYIQLFRSKAALKNLQDISYNADNSLMAKAVAMNLKHHNNHFYEKILKESWPQAHFLMDKKNINPSDNHVKSLADSRLFSTLASTKDSKTFADIYSRLISSDKNNDRVILQEFIMPLFERISDNSDHVFFKEICSIIENKSKSKLDPVKEVLIKNMLDSSNPLLKLMTLNQTSLNKQLKSISGFLYLHFKQEKFSNSRYALDQIFTSNGSSMDKLAMMYGTTRSPSIDSQLLYACIDAKKEPNAAILYQISPEISTLLNEPERLFNTLLQPDFATLCTQNNKKTENEICSLIKSLNSEQSSKFKQFVNTFDKERLAALPPTIARGIFSSLSKSVPEDLFLRQYFVSAWLKHDKMKLYAALVK